MKVLKYKKKAVWLMLGLGMVFLSIGIASFASRSAHISIAGFAVIGVAYIGVFLYRWKKQFGSIDHESIKIYGLWPKEVRIADIAQAQKVAGDYSFKTASAEIRISPDVIDRDSRKFLDKFVQDFQSGDLDFKG